ncbi:selenoprotein Pb [Columba livia]|uniref:Selenoprotein Pb n=1 Tax=Columba livia TaxID=8932 RepID=A0A2I0LYX2_COLLI|nr:selenoprotein Pb [Columba livia]
MLGVSMTVPPTWAAPSQHLLPHSLGGLRERLARQGMADVHYMIVNEKAPLSRIMFGELERQAPPGVPVFQPEPEEPDVWQVLGGYQDDFLVYDRCGRLAFHIQLPYSFLHFPYVESAIRFTHSKDFCGNCSLYPNTTQEANATMEVPVTLSPLPEQGGKESETPIHQHNPLHPHHHHKVGSERAREPSGDHEPAAHARRHHGDRSQPHHQGAETEGGK